MIEGRHKQFIKPTIGIMPKNMHDEIRCVELVGAIIRYTDALMQVPIEWVEEYNTLVINRE